MTLASFCNCCCRAVRFLAPASAPPPPSKVRPIAGKISPAAPNATPVCGPTTLPTVVPTAPPARAASSPGIEVTAVIAWPCFVRGWYVKNSCVALTLSAAVSLPSPVASEYRPRSPPATLPASPVVMPIPVSTKPPKAEPRMGGSTNGALAYCVQGPLGVAGCWYCSQGPAIMVLPFPNCQCLRGRRL